MAEVETRQNEAECVIYIRRDKKIALKSQYCISVQNTAEQCNLSPHIQNMLILVNLTLDHMRVVLQEKVVQVLGDEGRHAGVCQRCEEYKMSVKHYKRKKEGQCKNTISY